MLLILLKLAHTLNYTDRVGKIRPLRNRPAQRRGDHYRWEEVM